MQIELEYRCSKCESLGESKLVPSLNKMLRRCLVCGHEKVLWEMTTTPLNEGITIISIEPNQREEQF